MGTTTTTSTRSAQQAQRDVINVHRLLSRMEARMQQDGQHAAMKSNDEASMDYYQTLSTITSIKYARQLLEESVKDHAQQQTLAMRLNKVQNHYQSILQSIPNPSTLNAKSHNLEHLRPKVLPEATTTSTSSLENPSGSTASQEAHIQLPEETLEERAASDLLPLDEEPFDVTQARQRRHSSRSSSLPSSAITPLSTTSGISPEVKDEEEELDLSEARSSDGSSNTRPGPSQNNRTGINSNKNSRSSNNNANANATTQSLSNLLSHHRSEQETLTEELATMASRLKMNSLEFSQLLEKDKSLLEGAEEKLDGNLTGMIKERDRLKAYKKSGGVTTWFVIGAVIAVMLAWFFMFAIMRVF